MMTAKEIRNSFKSFFESKGHLVVPSAQEDYDSSVFKFYLNGELTENSVLPSVRQLAADLSVSAITIKRAYSDFA